MPSPAPAGDFVPSSPNAPAVQTLIVTGGGRGIGAAVSRAAAARGYAVAVNYTLDENAAETVAREIRAAGGRAAAIRADVAHETEVRDLFERAERELGPLAALVNNAGVTGPLTRLEALEASDLQRVLAVNVAGTILCAREAVRRLSTRHGGPGGAIVNLSSRAADLGGAGDWVHYAASKGAIDAFTRGLAREVAAEGIRVNAVAPGLIDTELHATAGAPDRIERLQKRHSHATRRQRGRRCSCGPLAALAGSRLRDGRDPARVGGTLGR